MRIRVAKMTRFSVLLLILATGCASPQPLHHTADFELKIEDVPDLERFDLQLHAKDSPICLGVNQWPDQFGRVDMSSPRAVVFTNSGRFEARNFNFGYCIGRSCTIRIAPRSQLNGFVAYSEFPSGSEIRASTRRRLEYAIYPYSC